MGAEEDEIRALQAQREGTGMGAAASKDFDPFRGAAGLSTEVVDAPMDDDDGPADADAGGSHPATRAARPQDGPADEDDGEDPFRAHREATGNARARAADERPSRRRG